MSVPRGPAQDDWKDRGVRRKETAWRTQTETVRKSLRKSLGSGQRLSEGRQQWHPLCGERGYRRGGEVEVV